MEGMPRLPMLKPEFKFPNAAAFSDFSLKIKEYIASHYEDDPKKYDSAFFEMESLRARLCSSFPDVETACMVKRYYAQLKMMKSRFPMEEGDPIRISFAWSDKSGDSSNCLYGDIDFELACVMYDIGAIHASIAAAEERIDPDSIKKAFMHFQCAAYPFQYIRDNTNASKLTVPDFDPAILTWYVNVLLAQAQECILEKSLIDHRKNVIIAKIAAYLKEVYKLCGETLAGSCASDAISSTRYNEWMRTCDVKCELYGAISFLHMGDNAEQEQKMGARLTYYEMAQKHVASALKYCEKDKRESLRQAVNFVHDVVTVKYTGAKKDNDFVYHDRIPKFEELPKVEPVTMVKPIGFDSADRSVSGDDLFAALLPMNVLKAVSVYTEEKAKFRRSVLERVCAKDQELETYLISLNLGEINLFSSDDIKLPDSLLEKSAAINSQPDAFPELLEKLKKVGDFAVEAEDKLTSLRNRLAAIDLLELTRDEGFLAISKELLKITDDHKKARENNTKLQKAIAMHSENLRILAMPLNELSRRIVGAVIKPSETSEGSHLKKMLEKANEMKNQREQLLRDLTVDLDNDDITAKCLAEKGFDNQELFKKELAKHEKTVKLIDMNLAAQTKILNALTDANASFAACRKQIMEANNSRKDQILALTAAYEVYCNVLQKANEGLKFYSTLLVMVRTLGEAIEGIEEAFASKKAKIEKTKKEAEEQSRKLKMAHEARETLRQFNGVIIRPGQLAAVQNNAMGGHLPMSSGSSSTVCDLRAPPCSSISTSTQQNTVIYNGGVTHHPASQQFISPILADASSIFPQSSIASSVQNYQPNLSVAPGDYSSQYLPQPSKDSSVPTSFSQPYSMSLHAIPTANTRSQNSSPQMITESILNPHGQARAVPPTNFSLSFMSNSQPQNLTQSRLSAPYNSNTSFSPLQQTPQQQAMHQSFVSAQHQSSGAFPEVPRTVWQQHQDVACTTHSVPPTICTQQFEPPQNLAAYDSRTSGMQVPRPSPQQYWQQQPNTLMSVPRSPAFVGQQCAVPQASFGLNSFGAVQQYRPQTMPQSAVMDIMNSPTVSNLPEPLVPQRNTTNM